MEKEFVSTVYIVQENKVLLMFHDELKRFIPVGGHIEENEFPCEAAVREAEEETGYKIKLIDFSDFKMNNLIPNFGVQLDVIKPDHHHFNISYIGKIVSGEELKESDEGTELRWFSEKDLIDSREIFENTREKALKAIELVREYGKGK